jgi:hypothetical protein
LFSRVAEICSNDDLSVSLDLSVFAVNLPLNADVYLVRACFVKLLCMVPIALILISSWA